jgi:antitoxin VapB
MTTSRPTPYTPAVPPPPKIAIEFVANYGRSTQARTVKLFRNGANQAVRIPKEFELPGVDALIHREGNKLIIEPAPQKPAKGTAAALALALDEMAKLGPIDEEFPDVDAGLLPLDDIDFGPDTP